LNKVIIYTDGSSPENSKGSGRGGYCAILTFNGHERVVSGRLEETTNNRAEMIAVIEGLRALKCPCEVTIVTDSEYVMRGVTEWMPRWDVAAGKNSRGKPLKNSDLWAALQVELMEHTVKWEWVRGHTGHPYNERCDEIARRESGV
jgi:ribonuclease HI